MRGLKEKEPPPLGDDSPQNHEKPLKGNPNIITYLLSMQQSILQLTIIILFVDKMPNC
jgi:hypothetical protein